MWRWLIVAVCLGGLSCSSDKSSDETTDDVAETSEPVALAPIFDAAPMVPAIDAAPPPPRLPSMSDAPIIPPPDDQIMTKVTLANVRANKWVAFGGTYWRLWGGAKTGSQPKSVSATPDGKWVFVNNVGFHDKKNVYQYDAVTLERKAVATFPGNAIEQVISNDSKTLFVSNFYHKQIVELNTDTLDVTRTFKVQNLPKGMTLSPDEKTLYVSNWAYDSMSIVDLDSGKATKHIKVGDRPRGVGITKDGKKLYVGNFLGHSISIIDVDAQKVVKTIAPCRGPRDAMPTEDGKFMLVSCYW